MAVNIVTGMTGIEHITSHDDRARNASQFGRGKYVFDIGRKFSATAVDDNLVRIQDGMCINQGTQMGIEPNDYVDVEIDNGLLGTNRHDIIVMRYEKNEETLLEKASLAVVKGVNSSEPVDPDITEGNILDGGDLVDDMPLYRVIIEGVNLVSIEPLFEVFDGDVGSILEELEDKVDKVTGKGLSTNDYTNEDKTKLGNIETGAEVNVQSDWSQNDNTADDFIKHKPGIPSKTSDLQNDSDFVSDANYVHTDNNYTNAEKEDVAKIDTLETNQTQILSDIEDLEHSLSTTSTATGNPISISNSAHVNAEKLTVELELKQDLHGYDKPWVGGAGKNLLPMTVDGIKNANTSGTWSGNSYTIDGVTFTIQTDVDNNVTGIKLDGSASTSTTLNLCSNKDFLPIGDYILTDDSQHPSDSVNVTLFKNNNWFGSTTSGVVLNVSSQGTDTFYAQIYVNSNAGTLSSYMFYPMIRLSTETDPTFEPYSNICPISGYDSTSVVRSNYVDLINSELVNGYYFGMDGEFHPVNSGYVATSEPIDIVGGGMYTVSSGKSGTDGAVVFYDSNGNFLNNTIISLATKVLSFTTPLNASKCAITVGSGDSDITIDNVGYIHLVQGVEPYTADTYTLQFGDTVYGAEVDFVRGVATVDRAIVDLGTLSWAKSTASQNITRYSSTGLRSSAKKPATNATIANALCSEFLLASANDGYAGAKTDCITIDIAADVSVYPTASYADVTAFKTAMQGVQFVYELATPTTIQLTPQQIKMLKGNNVLVADGDMDLAYQVDNVVGDVKEWAEDEFLPKASATAQHNYSTQEQVVGTWIDGSTLYEKTVSFGVLSSGTQTVAMGLNNTDTIVNIAVNAQTPSGAWCVLPMTYLNINNISEYGAIVDGYNSSTDLVTINIGSDRSFAKGYVTIQYTKTTD